MTAVTGFILGIFCVRAYTQWLRISMVGEAGKFCREHCHD